MNQDALTNGICSLTNIAFHYKIFQINFAFQINLTFKGVIFDWENFGLNNIPGMTGFCRRCCSGIMSGNPVSGIGSAPDVIMISYYKINSGTAFKSCLLALFLTPCQ